MLYVNSFAIVRLSVLTRPNPDMSRSRARGRSDSAHECRRRIKIVKFLGLIAKRSVPDSSYSPLHTTDETGLQYHLPARLLACRGARTRHITLWRRGRSREARPRNLVSAMQRFASESATSQASQGMSGARIRKRPFYLSSSATPTDSAVIRQTPTCRKKSFRTRRQSKRYTASDARGQGFEPRGFLNVRGVIRPASQQAGKVRVLSRLIVISAKKRRI